jgi:hypothetical protein
MQRIGGALPSPALCLESSPVPKGYSKDFSSPEPVKRPESVGVAVGVINGRVPEVCAVALKCTVGEAT